MPADDLVLNVRQIANYSPITTAPASGSILIQTAGLGSAYASISPQALVGTALSVPGNDMAIGGQLSVLSIQGGSAQFSNAAVNLLSAVKASFRELDAQWATIAGLPIATQAYVDGVTAPLVHSFNGRGGDVVLWIQDILKAGGAPIYSPRFMGTPHADTPVPWSNSTRIATTAFVHSNIVAYIDNFIQDHPFVFTFNGRTGDVVLTEEDIINAGGGTVFDSPNFTGVPTAPTAPYGTDTAQLATTQFVQAAISGQTQWAPLNSPAFSGYVTAPTVPPGTSDGQIATTAFVMNAVTESTTGVSSFNTRTGAITLEPSDIGIAGGALLASPQFTGLPTAPTAAPGNNSLQLATTAFVMNAIGTGGVASFNGREGAVVLTEADLTGAGGALLDSPPFTGLPSAPTATAGTSTTQLATTQFVMAAVGNSVVSFNGRTGAVTLTANDVSAASGLTNPSAALTGVPTAPTAAQSVNNTQIATTAYVQAALAASGGVSSFNGRAGAITLTLADVSGAGGAPSVSPGFTGIPTAPTAAPGVTTTQLATCAFVMAALAAQGGVSSFNTRTGAVTMALADITGAGGLAAANPAFTGTMTGPTLNLTGSLSVASSTLMGGNLGFNPGVGIRGVTDGSNAVAGNVGEVVSYQSGFMGLSGTSGSGNLVVVPAGDWDISGSLATAPIGGSIFAWFNGTVTVNGTSLSSISFPGGGQSLQTGNAFPAFRVSSSSSFTLGYQYYYGFQTGTQMQAAWAVLARRAR